MSNIKGKNTSLEVKVRKHLFAQGIRFRKKYSGVPGTPDIAIPGKKIAVFVHGCFWHQHPRCKHARIPKTNTEYWESKFQANRFRDEKQMEKLESLGWTVVVLWECELKSQFDEQMEILIRVISGSR